MNITNLYACLSDFLKKRFSKFSDLSSGITDRNSNLDAVLEEGEDDLNNSKDVINMD